MRGAQVPKVLVTGATGLIGSALVRDLRARGHDVRGAVRRSGPADAGVVLVSDLSSKTDWRRALDGVFAVVHTAGPAQARFSEAYLDEAIVGGTSGLTAQAVEAGVERFIFVSSIRACVARTTAAPANEATPAHPTDSYGRAKLEAEERVLATSTLNPVVLRPPLVVDAGAKGNLLKLMRLLDTPLPLPFGGMHNRRSIISLRSLAEAVALAINGSREARGVFHLADHPAVSTAEMSMLMREGMGRRCALFGAPVAGLFSSALRDNLEVDDERIRAILGYAGADARNTLVACGQAWVARR